MDDSTFSVTTDALHCDILNSRHMNTSSRLLLQGTAIDFHVSTVSCNLKEKCHFLNIKYVHMLVSPVQYVGTVQSQ